MSIAEILETMDYGKALESADQAMDWLDRNKRRFGVFIDNEFREPVEAQYFDTSNPANGEKLAEVAQGSVADVNAAVAAARKAQPAWAKLGGPARARYLYALARLIQKHARLLAVVETLDNGKPIRESRDIDLPLVARHFYHHAGWAQLMESEMPGYDALGVAGQVIPWNFPLLMLAWKISPALAMGNCIVLKPAEYTSLSALLFAEICIEAGLPKGVVNIVTGDGRTGALITEHEDIDKIAFTGSTAVGRMIRKKTAGSGKKLTLELGGKSPFIVFDDADIDSAVEGVVDSIWFNQGQVCCAGSRLLLHEPIADKMIARLRARMENLRVGDPMDKSIDIGAIVAPVQLAQIEKMVALGVAEGATLYQPKASIVNDGCFYPPTLLCDIETSATLAQEEVFGPVLVTMTFRTPEEAVQIANNTRYGLAASVWSENINLVMDIAPKLKAGIVWINCSNQFDAAAGFGGVRESGFGREGGREGLYEYVSPSFLKNLKPVKPAQLSDQVETDVGAEATIDRTAKMYIGGKQQRPDSGYSRAILSSGGGLIGHVGNGNRKDIRNAVEAASGSKTWAAMSGHARAQVIYYLAENLAARKTEFAKRISSMTGAGSKGANAEVSASLERLFSYAAWADKNDGAVHSVPLRGVVMAMKEANGVMGLICPDEAPLLGLVSLLAPAIAMGNSVIVVPSSTHPLLATDFYQVLDTSDFPAGVVNIVTGDKDELAATLADHYGVDAIWYHGSASGSAAIEKASAGNLKRTWVNDGKARDWYDRKQSEGEEYLRHATQVKNVWVPYGE